MSGSNAAPLGKAAAPTGRAKRELEEARKAGTLAPEVDAVTGQVRVRGWARASRAAAGWFASLCRPARPTTAPRLPARHRSF